MLKSKWDYLLYIVPCVFIIFIFFVNGLFFLNTHEKIHRVIFGNYGIESETNYLLMKGSAYTRPNQTQYDEKCTENCRLANDLSEVVGYNVSVIMFSMWCGLISIMAFIVFFEIVKRRYENGKYARYNQ
ncbi:MAG: hypothetical protein ACOC56_01460 [Atribacterota bacterium]